MKRVIAVLVAVLLLCPFIASAGSLVDALNAEFNDNVSCAAIGDRLVIVADYDRMADVPDSDVKSVFDQFTDELAPYSSVVMLFLKNGVIYLGAEMPLVNGVFTNGTGSPLMSVQFMRDNMSIGD